MNEEADLQSLRAAIIEALSAPAPKGAEAERLAALGHTMAQRAREDFPVFHQTLNLLGYHNWLALINEMMAIGWEQVQDAASYNRAAVDAYAARATDHLIYDYLEASSHDDGPRGEGLDALVARLERYIPVDAERLRPYVLLLSGEAGRAWSTADFDTLAVRNLGGLMIEFVGYAHRAAGVPYARAHLVREQLPRYFLERAAGNLYPRLDVAARLRREGPPRPILPPEPAHLLVPDRTTLELFLERLAGTVNAQPYAAAAMAQMIPTWLNFLQARQLVQAQEAEGAAQELHAVVERVDGP